MIGLLNEYADTFVTKNLALKMLHILKIRLYLMSWKLIKRLLIFFPIFFWNNPNVITIHNFGVFIAHFVFLYEKKKKCLKFFVHNVFTKNVFYWNTSFWWGLNFTLKRQAIFSLDNRLYFLQHHSYSYIFYSTIYQIFRHFHYFTLFTTLYMCASSFF